MPRGLGSAPGGKATKLSVTQPNSLFSLWLHLAARQGLQIVVLKVVSRVYTYKCYLWEGESVTRHSTITDTETLRVFLCEERRWQLKKKQTQKGISTSLLQSGSRSGFRKLFLERARYLSILGFVGHLVFVSTTQLYY